MKLKRSIVAVAAVTTAAALSLVGCGSSDNSNASNTATSSAAGASSNAPAGPKVTSINYWYWQDVTTDQTINNLAAEFKKKTGITVNITDSVAYPQFYDKLINSIAAGNAPDATHVNTNMLGQLEASHALAPLDTYIDSWSGKDTIADAMWSYVKSPDGKTTYAMPNKFLMFYMFYRTDIFQADGITSFPKTQAEFVEMNKKLYNPSKHQYGFDIRGGTGGQDQWAAWLAAGGAQFLDSSGNVAFNSDATKKSNDLYISMSKYAPPGAVNDGYPQILANLKSGTSAVVINHLGGAKTLDAALGDKVGVALIPSLTGDPSQTTYMGTMNANAVLANSPKKEAAFEWISFLDSNDAQMAIANSPNGYLPVTKQAQQDPTLLANPNIAVSIEAAKGKTTSWPAIPGTTVASTKTWEPLFQGAVLGKNSNDAVIEGIANALKTGR